MCQACDLSPPGRGKVPPPKRIMDAGTGARQILEQKVAPVRAVVVDIIDDVS